MAVTVHGKLTRINEERGELVFKVAFFNQSMQEGIDSLLAKEGMHKLTFAAARSSGRYGQQKRLFGSLGLILDSILGRKHTGQEMDLFYQQVVKQFFPVKTYHLGAEEIISPVLSLSELSSEERDRIVEDTQEFYSHLNIDFSAYGY